MDHPPEPGLIDAVQKMIGGAATALLAAAAGRMMWHAGEVRAGRRPAFGPFLIWEIPMAVGMALIGDGAGEYLGLSGKQTTALIAILSYLGPRGICAALERWWARRKDH